METTSNSKYIQTLIRLVIKKQEDQQVNMLLFLTALQFLGHLNAKHLSVVQSSYKAKYIATSEAIKEAVWNGQFLEKLH